MSKKLAKKHNLFKMTNDYANALTSITSTSSIDSWNDLAEAVKKPRENIIGTISILDGKLVLKTEDKIVPIENVEEIKKIVTKTLLKQQNEISDIGKFGGMTFTPSPGVTIMWGDPKKLV